MNYGNPSPNVYALGMNHLSKRCLSTEKANLARFHAQPFQPAFLPALDDPFAAIISGEMEPLPEKLCVNGLFTGPLYGEYPPTLLPFRPIVSCPYTSAVLPNACLAVPQRH